MYPNLTEKRQSFSEIYYGEDHKEVVFDGTIIAEDKEFVFIKPKIFKDSWIILRFMKETLEKPNQIIWEIRDGHYHISFWGFNNKFGSVLDKKIEIGIMDGKSLGIIAYHQKLGKQNICHFQVLLGGNYGEK